jgi:hypothetical protein
MSELAHVCEACDKRQRVCSGKCLCTVSGKDVLEHYQLASCPLNKFTKEAIEAAKAGRSSCSEGPIPYADWPSWARCVKVLRKPVDSGVGDSVRRLLGAHGETFKKMLKSLGVECGCSSREREWNCKYPYDGDL